MFPYGISIISRVTKGPNDFPVQQNLISSNNPFILPTLTVWSTTDWFPSVTRSLHWTPHHSEGGSSVVVTSSFFLSRASWSKFYVLVNFCVLVWLSFPWRYFITLSDIIRTCGHVMDDFITLWWSSESWYDFSPSWTKCLSWYDFVCLGVIL